MDGAARTCGVKGGLLVMYSFYVCSSASTNFGCPAVDADSITDEQRCGVACSPRRAKFHKAMSGSEYISYDVRKRSHFLFGRRNLNGICKTGTHRA
jgi:hypothetical protein